MQQWDDHALNEPLTALYACDARAVIEFAIACAARAFERCEDSDEREVAEETVELARKRLATNISPAACNDASLYARDLANNSPSPARYVLLAAHHAAEAVLGSEPSPVNRACAAAENACLVADEVERGGAEAEANWQDAEIAATLSVARGGGHPPSKSRPTSLSTAGAINRPS
jgi:hypothetical protein